MTQLIVERWADMNNIPFLVAAREIKYLIEIGTVEKEKRPFAEGRLENISETVYHEIG